MKRTLSFLLVSALALFSLTACHKEDNPADVGTVYSGLSGPFYGYYSDSSGRGTCVWNLAQNGSDITGTMEATDLYNFRVFDADISGTLTGSTLSLTITVPVGNFFNDPSCSATSTGTANTDGNTRISGAYAGNNTCTGDFDEGAWLVTR